MVRDIAAYYEVRRVARWPGVFQQERTLHPPEPSDLPPWRRRRGGGGGWQPVGTLAVETIQRLQPVAGSTGPPREMLQDLASFWRAVVVWQQSGSAEFVKRYPGQILSLRHKLGIISDSIRFVGMRTSHRTARADSAVRFSVLDNEAGAVYLSAAFGVLANRIRICTRCDEPFVTDLKRPNQGICDSCRDLPKKLRRLFTRIRKRLDQQVSQGTRSRPNREQSLGAMWRELRRVQAGDMTVSAWEQRWDEGTKRLLGRPPKGAVPRTRERDRPAPPGRSAEPVEQRTA